MTDRPDQYEREHGIPMPTRNKGTWDPTHDRERAAEARHGGRYITEALARGLDRYPHLRTVLADCASPDFPYLTLSDAWRQYLSPSGSQGNGADTTASLARKAADGQDVFGNRPTYRRTLAEAEAMMGWPIYRAAMAACTSDDPTNHQGDTCPVHEA